MIISYGGIFERGSREWTLDDFYSLQLDKMDRYICLKESGIVITEGDDESDENDDEEESDSESDSESDDGWDTETVVGSVMAKEDDVKDFETVIEQDENDNEIVSVAEVNSLCFCPQFCLNLHQD